MGARTSRAERLVPLCRRQAFGLYRGTQRQAGGRRIAGRIFHYRTQMEGRRPRGRAFRHGTARGEGKHESGCRPWTGGRGARPVGLLRRMAGQQLQHQEHPAEPTTGVRSGGKTRLALWPDGNADGSTNPGLRCRRQTDGQGREADVDSILCLGTPWSRQHDGVVATGRRGKLTRTPLDTGFPKQGGCFLQDGGTASGE